jgi:hypothetical protein
MDMISLENYFDKWTHVEIDSTYSTPMIKWCENRMGIRGLNWLVDLNYFIQEEVTTNTYTGYGRRACMFMFRDEGEAVLFILKFSGKMYNNDAN